VDETKRFARVNFSLRKKGAIEACVLKSRKAKTLKEADFWQDMAIFGEERICRGIPIDFNRRGRSRKKTKKQGEETGKSKLYTGITTLTFSDISKPFVDSDGEDSYDAHWGVFDLDREAAIDLYFVPDSYTEVYDPLESLCDKQESREKHTLGLRLYNKLREISEESAALRMIVAFYIKNNGYLESLSELQAEYWETDLYLLNLLEADENYQVQWLLSYTLLDESRYRRHLAYIKRKLSKLCKAYGIKVKAA